MRPKIWCCMSMAKAIRSECTLIHWYTDIEHCSSVCNHKLCFSISTVRYCTVLYHPRTFFDFSAALLPSVALFTYLKCTQSSAYQTVAEPGVHKTTTAMHNTYMVLRTSVKARCFRCSHFFLSSYACEAIQSVCQTLARIEHISSLQVVHSFEFTSYDFIMRYRNFHNKCTAFFCTVATFIGIPLSYAYRLGWLACLHAYPR